MALLSLRRRRLSRRSSGSTPPPTFHRTTSTPASTACKKKRFRLAISLSHATGRRGISFSLSVLFVVATVNQHPSYIRVYVQVRQRLLPELEPRAHRQDDRVSAAVLLAGHTWRRHLLPRHLGWGGGCALDALPRTTIQLRVAGTNVLFDSGFSVCTKNECVIQKLGSHKFDTSAVVQTSRCHHYRLFTRLTCTSS